MTINWTDLLHDDYQTVAEMLHGHHHDENMTQDMMAEHLGVSTDSIKVISRKLGVKYKRRYGKPYSRVAKIAD